MNVIKPWVFPGKVNNNGVLTPGGGQKSDPKMHTTFKGLTASAYPVLKAEN